MAVPLILVGLGRLAKLFIKNPWNVAITGATLVSLPFAFGAMAAQTLDSIHKFWPIASLVLLSLLIYQGIKTYQVIKEKEMLMGKKN